MSRCVTRYCRSNDQDEPNLKSHVTQHASGWTGGTERYGTSSKQVRRRNGWNPQVEALLQLGSQKMHSALLATYELSDYIPVIQFKFKSDWALQFRGLLCVPLNPAHAKTIENLPFHQPQHLKAHQKCHRNPRQGRHPPQKVSRKKRTRRNAATCAAVGSKAELLY